MNIREQRDMCVCIGVKVFPLPGSVTRGTLEKIIKLFYFLLLKGCLSPLIPISEISNSIIYSTIYSRLPERLDREWTEWLNYPTPTEPSSIKTLRLYGCCEYFPLHIQVRRLVDSLGAKGATTFVLRLIGFVCSASRGQWGRWENIRSPSFPIRESIGMQILFPLLFLTGDRSAPCRIVLFFYRSIGRSAPRGCPATMGMFCQYLNSPKDV